MLLSRAGILSAELALVDGVWRCRACRVRAPLAARLARLVSLAVLSELLAFALLALLAALVGPVGLARAYVSVTALTAATLPPARKPAASRPSSPSCGAWICTLCPNSEPLSDAAAPPSVTDSRPQKTPCRNGEMIWGQLNSNRN